MPNVDQLEREIASGTPLKQLAGGRKLADRLRARGDELLDSYVEAARASRSSWTEIGARWGQASKPHTSDSAP